MSIVIVDELSEEDIQKAREEYSGYIKITIDILKNIAAIGGEYHADAEEVLINKYQCRSENIWGGGYNIKLKKFETNAVLNIKPQINDSSEIIDSWAREKFLKIAKNKLINIESYL